MTEELTPEQAKEIITKAENDRCNAFSKELETLMEKYQVTISPVVQIINGQITQSLQISARQ